MKEFKELEEIDLKLLLLSGSSIRVDNLDIVPYTLREIKDYGYSKYMQNLQWLSISLDDFIGSVLDMKKRFFLEQKKSNLKTFDFYIKLGGIDLRERVLDSISMIFRTDDVKVLDSENVIVLDFHKKEIFSYDKNGELIVNNKKLDSLNEDEIKIIHRDNFDDIVEVVKLQNYLERIDSKIESKYNPADEETRALIEHMEKLRKKVEEKKRKQQQQDNDDNIDIADIIDAVSSKSKSLNKLNIWDLTLYQLYSEYSRLEIIDKHDISVKAIMAGAKDIDYQHWASKM